MARYIDADALLAEIEGIYQRHYANSVYQFIHDFFRAVLRRINKAPTIKARPAVRGEWIEKPHTDGFGGYYFLSHCSRCNTPNAKKRNFCNECGADMRGDDDETD